MKTTWAAAVIGLLLITPGQATAQGDAAADPGHAVTDLSGGYAWLREIPEGGGPSVDYNRGWTITGARRLFGTRLLVVGEVGASRRENLVQETQHVRAVLGGVRYRITRGRRLATFVQGLIGTERFSEPGLTQNGVAFQPGGGLDLRLMGPSGLRLQADYRIARQEAFTFRHPRLAVSYALWLGR